MDLGLVELQDSLSKCAFSRSGSFVKVDVKDVKVGPDMNENKTMIARFCRLEHSS